MKSQDFKNAYFLLDNYRKANLLLPEEKWPHEISRALEYLNQNIFEVNCTIHRMREDCRIPQQNFSSRFKNYIGLTPIKYLVEHRIKAALKLIETKEINLSKSQIGFLVGYDKPSSFIKALNKHQ